MSEEEIIEKINWSIQINEMTKSINGNITHINVNVLLGLLDLYNTEKQLRKELIMKNKTMIDKFKDMIKAEMQEVEDMDWDEACFLPLERLLKDVEELEENV